MTRLAIRAFVLLAALALAHRPAPAAPAPAVEAPPTFKPDSATVQADEHLQWTIEFTVENKFPGGIYLDSLYCEIQDLDPGETRAERVRLLDVSQVVVDNTISAGENYSFTYVAPAIAEHAKLSFRLVLHRADKSLTVLTTGVEALPGPVSRDHPSQFLTVGGKRVECVLFHAGGDSTEGILLVHGYGSNARQMMRSAMRLNGRGYTVMLASMPGYGQSDGPPDYNGPATIKALGAVLDQLKKTPGVNPNAIAAWGISRGAAAATLLAQSRPDLKAVIAESGTYDMWSIYRAAPPERQKAIVAEVGSDSSAWRARSPALGSGKPTAILVFHGEKDPLAPAQQAHGFVESLKARGVQVESRFFPNSGHDLPPGEVLRTAFEFLTPRFK